MKLTVHNKKMVGQPRNARWNFALKELWAWIGKNEAPSRGGEEVDLEKPEHRQLIISKAEEGTDTTEVTMSHPPTAPQPAHNQTTQAGFARLMPVLPPVSPTPRP